MPRRSYRKVLDEGLDDFAKQWAQQEEKKEKVRAKKKGQKTDLGVLFSIRNKRIGIKEGADKRRMLEIIYKKTTTGEVNKYIIAPYSWRYRQLKIGRRKMLYAYDPKAGRIKSFALRNIRNVLVTKRRYSPKWPVEI